MILISSNPATIMTDPELATRTYIEPVTPEAVTSVIIKEQPDAILPTMGGQTALNVAFQLHQQGVLSKHNVELIGANFEAIRISEDREAFKKMLQSENLEILRSQTVSNYEDALKIAEELGFPLIIRPSFTLGGSGGSVVYTESEFQALVAHGLSLSPIGEILIEESALGWKEYEFEVMRDTRNNVVIVCSVENLDPMGVHTGDSITVAPAQTLSDKEYHVLRDASIRIIRAVGVDAGGCNIQFAIHPDTGRVIVIEMNPRVSRSSALVSKATGVPIAKISARLAVGYTLDEIPNDITQTTPASFEPAIDYVVTKIPRFSFEKFPGSISELSPQMKSVGEVMAIGATFQESFQKALRGLEVGLSGFYFPALNIQGQAPSRGQILEKLLRPSSDRIQWLYYAFRANISTLELNRLTGIDLWFLENLAELSRIEDQLRQDKNIAPVLLQHAKKRGFSDAQIALLTAQPAEAVRELRLNNKILPVYKAVDTCAGEFEAETPYFYSTYDGMENEAPVSSTPNKKVMILGGGPNRIGQGIEFDYCCVHAAQTLQALGYEAIMVNSNPETVSTDYDISDRLYFEPMTPEDVLNVIEQEKPAGIIAQLGGQTPLKLSQSLRGQNIPILGTSTDSIDLAEDRDKLGKVLTQLGLKAPESGIERSEAEAPAVAHRIGFPLIARPSYVLGGQSMQIFYSEKNLKAYLANVVKVQPDYPVLIERFLESAKEVDVDAVCDGQSVYIGAVLEHIEHAGVHSGDSSCVWPVQTISKSLYQEITEATRALALALSVKGLLNIQFAICDEALYVLEVNPRASRTVPFVSKATGVPLVRMAIEVLLGKPLSQLLPVEPLPAHVAVKVPVFPFIKFKETDPTLGPEMRSTGEVMGIDQTFSMAFAKALIAAGHTLPSTGNVFISVNNADKPKALEVAKLYERLGFRIVATAGTAAYFQQHGLHAMLIPKKHEGQAQHAEALIAEGFIQLVVNTPAGESALADDSYIRKAAILYNVPMAATVSGAMAMAEAIEALGNTAALTVTSLQESFLTRLSGSMPVL